MSENADIQAALREMSGTIGGLKSTVDTMLHTWQSQETNASAGRRDLHQKMEALRQEVTKLTADVTAAAKDITDIKPDVQDFRNAKQQAKGMEKVGKWLFGGIGVFGTMIGGALGWAVSNYITIGPKPPLPPLH